MSEQLNHICEICGGAKNLNLPKLKTSHGFPVTPAIPPELRTGHICLGHPEPTPKHDGKLDTRTFHDGSHAECQIKQGGMVLEVSDSVGITMIHAFLEPQQALSLLAWLRQEEETLKRLAEEQAECG